MNLNLEYIAGFVDGEGCVNIAMPPAKGIRLVVTNTNRPILEAMQATFDGVGRIFTKRRAAGEQGRLPCYSWTVCDRQAEGILRQLLPHLVVKRYEAELALEYRGLVTTRGALPGTWGTAAVPAANMQRRLELATAARDTKRAAG